MKNNLPTILISILLALFIFETFFDNNNFNFDYYKQQNDSLLARFDKIKISIDSLELKLVSNDTTINYYRNNYYEVSKGIDSVTNISILRDSVRSILFKLGSPRFSFRSIE